MQNLNIEKIEYDLLIETIYRRYGYDFRNYSKASLKRRLMNFIEKNSYTRMSELILPVLTQENFFYSLLTYLSVTVTELFRDPSFFVAFREHVVPTLKTYPFVRVWHAGCATGEELYSMAITLHETNLLKKTMLYGTDINEKSLGIAKEGVCSVKDFKNAEEKYLTAGGNGNLSTYFIKKYQFFKARDFLKENVVLSTHNLVSDGVFNEFQVIFCKNVLIYFNKDLQNKVLNLLADSLSHRGFLCIGSKESIDFLEARDLFEMVSQSERIYKKRARYSRER